MTCLFETVFDLEAGAAQLRRRRYGVIEIEHGRLTQIRLKPFPKIGSLVEVHWISQWRGKRRPADRCQLFYNQPVQHTNFLTLSYIESTFQTSWKSISRALRALDHIARIKRSDAILTEVSNTHISDRLMRRLGWERHLPKSRKRHYIKRFYGQFPPDNLVFAEANHTR
jgi:hypothetical protein